MYIEPRWEKIRFTEGGWKSNLQRKKERKIKENEDEKSQKYNLNLFLENNYEKNITGDGNCYYRCLSYYYRGLKNII